MSNYIIYNPQGGREGHSYQYTTNLCVGLLGIGKTVDLVTSPDFDSKCIEDSGAGVTFTNTNNSKSKWRWVDLWRARIICTHRIL